MSDDQGWNDTGYGGRPGAMTPNLDAMAANGLRLDRFYAACPKCSPTRGSFLTGRHPFRWGFFNGANLNAKERTIAEVMREAGYRTAHFGKWHMGKVTDPKRSPAGPGFDYFRSHNNYFETDPVFHGEDGQDHQMKGDGSVAAINETIVFIEDCLKRKKPSFSIVWYGSPHGPIKPAEEDLKAIKPAAKGRAYLAEIHGIDRSIGLLHAAYAN